eukprot:Hpha_TRINITY_DN15766_c3_g5::TRINITY_DN15766_c3_g5_i1::g.36313::m.36313/K01209/abfA; alpha-N-arabinofuranosidase
MRAFLLLMPVLAGGSIVSPLLFGANLEFTRHDVFAGISSEMLANRKFQRHANEGADVPRWSLVGGASPVNSSLRRRGTSIHCNATGCGAEQGPVGGGYNPGQNSGTGVVLQSGVVYSISVVARGVANLIVRADGIAMGQWEVNSAEWEVYSENYTHSGGDINGTNISVTVEGTVRDLVFDSISLTPVHNTFEGLRRDVIAALSKMVRGTLRYPGGCYASVQGHNFRDMLLPQHLQPVVETPAGFCPAVVGGVNAYTDRFLENGFGTDVYAKITAQIGAVGGITPRLVMGTEEEIETMADWINYTESRGLGVRDWYLGNEANQQRRYPGPYPENSSWFPPPSPEVYATMTEAAAVAMRKAAGAAGEKMRFYGVAGNDAWLKALLSRPKFLHAVSFHGGYSNQPLRWTAASSTTAAKVPTDTVLPALRTLRSTLDAKGGDYVGISADEWGLGPPWTVRDGFGTPHALFAASFLSGLMAVEEELKVVAANYFEPINEGALIVEPGSVRFTPLGEVLSLFVKHSGANLTAVSPDMTADVIFVSTLSTSEQVTTVINRNATAQGSTAIGILKTGKLVTTVWTASGFLPSSTFSQTSTTREVMGGQTVSVEIPPYSVAQFVI